MELDGGRSPRGEGTGGLAPRQGERAAEPGRVELGQLGYRSRAPEWSDHPRRVPAALAKRRVVGTQSHPDGGLETGRDRQQELCA